MRGGCEIGPQLLGFALQWQNLLGCRGQLLLQRGDARGLGERSGELGLKVGAGGLAGALRLGELLLKHGDTPFQLDTALGGIECGRELLLQVVDLGVACGELRIAGLELPVRGLLQLSQAALQIGVLRRELLFEREQSLLGAGAAFAERGLGLLVGLPRRLELDFEFGRARAQAVEFTLECVDPAAILLAGLA